MRDGLLAAPDASVRYVQAGDPHCGHEATVYTSKDLLGQRSGPLASVI